MELDGLKQALLELLNKDGELRGLIRGIAGSRELPESAGKNSPADASYGAEADRRPMCLQSGYNEKMPEPEEQRGAAPEEVRNLNEQLRQKENSLASLKQEYQRQKQQLADLENEVLRLQEQLREGARSLAALSQDAADKETACQNMLAELQNERTGKRRLQDSLEELNGEAAALREENGQQSQELERLRQELAQRFPQGWELFRAYHSVSSSTRELLRGVFVRGDDFASFICGAAQSASLEKIWKTVKECVVKGNTGDADILWDIFEYAVELVNASKPEKIYEILQAERGMPFDLEVHALAPGSPAQGKVREIYLLGYKNVYVGRVEQKSIVSL